MIKKILVLSSGGDAPGMNAAIRAVVRTALHANIEVFGAIGGYQGIFNEQIIPMDADSVANCILRGGTILHTARFEAFHEASVRAQVVKMLQRRGIDALVVLGGDGSFRGAKTLADESQVKVIGIPCTIDNDIEGTEYSIGFDTACNTALQAIDKIRDTAFSLNRNFLVEVMGRASGFLAVDVGIAGGAEFILIPESSTQIEKMCQKIQKRKRGKLASIIVVAEAGEPGRSIQIAKEIKQRINIDYKVCILGHVQRGGTPTVLDRKIASLMGAQAVNALIAGESKLMTACISNQLRLVAFPEAHVPARQFNDKEILKINGILCDI